MAFRIGCQAVYVKPGGRRIQRSAHTGFGVGGPIEPSLWCLASVPIIVGAFVAARAPAPAFVDDVAFLVWTLVGLAREPCHSVRGARRRAGRRSAP
eukprot:1725465-Alexandrium_andersonii.AAC.1